MPNVPSAVSITEEGPREGFQFERGAIPTARKIELIDALSGTGLEQINIVSFVNPKAVPGMADADEVVRGISPRPGVRYTGLWLNERGFERAIATGRLALEGTITLSGSEAFLLRNQHRTAEQQTADQHALLERYAQHAVPVTGGFIMAAFGCNFSGDVPVSRVVRLAGELVEIAAQHGIALQRVTLGDTMAWATPLAVKRVVDAVRGAFPEARTRSALARHARHGDRQCVRRSRDGRGPLRWIGGRSGRLPLRRSRRRGRQRLHRGPRFSVRRDGHSDGGEPRTAHRMRAARGSDRRPPLAGVRHARRSVAAAARTRGGRIDFEPLGWNPNEPFRSARACARTLQRRFSGARERGRSARARARPRWLGVHAVRRHGTLA